MIAYTKVIVPPAVEHRAIDKCFAQSPGFTSLWRGIGALRRI
jgi:hypothetical protein